MKYVSLIAFVTVGGLVLSQANNFNSIVTALSGAQVNLIKALQLRN